MKDLFLMFLLGALLLAVPAYVLFRLDRRVLRRTATALGRAMAVMLVWGVCLKYLVQWNSGWLNVLWLLLSVGLGVGVVAPKRWFWVPVFVGVLPAVTVVGLLVLLVAFGAGRLMEAVSFIPVMSLLLADATVVAVRGLQAYAYARRSHLQVYEYLLGNGAKRFEALRPFFTKAIASAVTPSAHRLSVMGLVGLPALLCGLLVGGSSPLWAAVLTLLIVAASFGCSMLALMLALYVFERMK